MGKSTISMVIFSSYVNVYHDGYILYDDIGGLSHKWSMGRIIPDMKWKVKHVPNHMDI